MTPSTPAEIDRAVEAVHARAAEFARLAPLARATLLHECADRTAAVAEGWAREAAAAKGLRWGTPSGAEDMITGPMLVIRHARLLAASLDAIAERGRPPLGRGARRMDDGRLEVDVFPTSAMDGAAYMGYRASVLMLPGVDEAAARDGQAPAYGQIGQEGSVSAVLGAGNVSSIPANDVIHKLFAEGRVCVLKMNPVNEYVGPYLERALEPLVRRDFLRIVYGGGEEGARLVEHAGVDDVHVTGSAATFDRIVWGPPGPDRERRRESGDPLLRKTITSELGNVTPVIVAPGRYTDRELAFQARAVASATVNNASFNCNAAKMLVVGRDWPQRERFGELLVSALAEAGPRCAYYPGALDRYETLLAGRDGVRRAGEPEPSAPAWAFVPDLDPDDRAEPLFSTEPFCGILSETALPEREPAAFLPAATRFCNERLWGTLCAEVVTPRDPELRAVVDQAVRDLRYGTVGVNVWPAVSYVMMCTPWGGHASATPADIQSGLGWVHNTYLLDGIDKAVVRAPLVAPIKPVWHYDHRSIHRAAADLVEMERRPSWPRLVRVAARTIRG